MSETSTYDWLCNGCSDGIEEALTIGNLTGGDCARCGKRCEPSEIRAVTKVQQELAAGRRVGAALRAKGGHVQSDEIHFGHRSDCKDPMCAREDGAVVSEKHSPGPWTWTVTKSLVASDCNLVASATCDTPGGEHYDCDVIVSDADARLIAAAPTMLELLRRAVATCDGVRRACYLGTCEHGYMEELIDGIDGKVG